MVEIELTDAQKQAIKALERALRQCKKAGVYFHNCYGTLKAYDGAVVRVVDNDKGELDCDEGQFVNSPYNLDSHADDRHYIHLTEQAKGR